MKTALVIERMDPLRGGKETYTARLAEELSRRGHDVTVLCQSSSWEPAEATITCQPLGRRGATRLAKLRNFQEDLRPIVESGRFDVVHSMLPVPGANVYHPHGGAVPASIEGGLRRHAAAARPIARLLKGFSACRRESARIERQVVEDSGATCVCVSDMVAKQFSRHYRPTNPPRVVFNGVDVPDPASSQRAHWRQEMRFRMGVGSEAMVFLTIATNFPLKGVTETIAAFAKWYHGHPVAPEARLVVVGRDFIEGYDRFAGLRDVGSKVIFVPPTREIFKWYAVADAVVLLTWYDPCSLVVLEAARWGIPSITTRFNGAAEAFSGGGCLVVDSPRDTRAVISSMDELADPEQRRVHCDACRSVADSLSLERHVDELLQVYQQAGGLA